MTLATTQDQAVSAVAGAGQLRPEPTSAGDAPLLSAGDAADRILQVVAPRHQLPSWMPWFLLRLVSGVGAVLVLSVVVFAATQALPSDPARVILGPDAPEQSVQTLRHQLGLERPLYVQYIDWLGRVLTGDFGRSLDSHVPVTQLVGARLGSTIALLSCVTVAAIPLAFGLGVLLALRRDGLFDRCMVAALIGLKAIPSFVVAIGLIMFFATSVFQVLPAVSLLDPLRSPFAQLQYLVLPAATLLLAGVPYLVRLVRASMIEVLQSEYVVQARLRGIPEPRIILRHALPNALIPAVQGIALTLSVLLGGTLIVEVVFTCPGLGGALNTAVQTRDIPVIQAIVLILTTGVVGINLSADLLTVLLTPRLRTAGRIRFISKKLRGASRGGWRSPGRALPHAPAHGQTAAVASKR